MELIGYPTVFYSLIEHDRARVAIKKGKLFVIFSIFGFIINKIVSVWTASFRVSTKIVRLLSRDSQGAVVFIYFAVVVLGYLVLYHSSCRSSGHVEDYFY